MLDGAAAGAAVAEATDQPEQNADNGSADNASTDPAAQAANSDSDNGGDASDSADAGQAGPAASQSVIIVDASVADAQTLLTGVDPSAQVFYLNAGTDGIQQITNILAGFSNVSDLHILSHGSTGSVTLGATTVDASNIESYASQFVEWDVALSEGADILLYGCNVGQDDAGMDFIDLFAELTNADVAASNDATASSALGGDWDLEVATGSIEASTPIGGAAAESYGFKLAIPTVTSFTRDMPVTTPTNTDTVTFLATFSEDVTNVDLADFAVTGTTATVTGVTQVTASSYQIAVSGGDLAGLDGMIGLDLAAAPSINALAGGAALVNAEPATDETYLLDNTAPGAPSTPDLLSGSDSGASPVDDITSDTTPTLTGTGEVGATIRIFSQLQGQVGTATVNAGNTWQVTTDALINGIHNLSSTATDAAGNVSGPSIPRSVTIDTGIIPSSTPDLLTASDTGSSGTDDITANNTPTFTGTAEAGIPAGATVTIISSLGGTLGTTSADGSGNWSFTSGALAEGVHQITSTSVDAAGNTHAASAPLTVTIDTTAPGTPSTPDLLTASDTGASDTDDNTADNTPTLSGTSEPNATITVISSIAGTLGTATADGTGAWTFTAPALANGTHILTATATDLAGNISIASAGLTIVVDTAAPVAPSMPDLLTASDSGTSNSDNITNNATPTFTGTAAAGATIEVFAGMTSLGSTIAAGGTWSFTPMAALGDGAHTITATATDAAGNISAASGALIITIDTIAPAMAGTPDLFTSNDSGISNSDDITSDNTPALLGTAEPNSIVELFDGAFRLGQVNAANSGGWGAQLQLAADGVHVYTARATDAAGNVGAPSAGLSVTIDTRALAPAGLDLVAASDTGSSDADDITSLTTPTITGTAEAGAAITLTSNLDGAVGTTTADAFGNWTITTAALSENTHNLTATQTDLAGNGSPTSTALIVIIDQTAPALTSFTRGNPAVSPTNADTLQFIATFDEAVANVSASDFAVTGTTATVTGVVQLANPMTYQITVSGGDLAGLDGTVNIDLAGAQDITDLAGNALPATQPATDESYTLENTAPTLQAFARISPATSPTNSDTLIFRAVFSEDVANVSVGDFVVNSATTAGITSFSQISGSVYQLEISGGDLAGFDGTVNIDLAAGQDITDLVGNALPSGEPAIDQTFIVDNSAPAAPTALDLANASDLGVSNTDDFTHIATPTITGTAEAGATVTLTSSIDGTVGTATAGSNGAWSIVTTALSGGVHTFTATARDPGGNTGPASAPLVVTIDLSVPILTDFNGGATFTEGGNPRRIDGDVQISDMQNDALNGGNGDYAGARFVLERTGGGNADDFVQFANDRGVRLMGAGITEIASGDRFGTIILLNGTVTVAFNSIETPATTALVNATLQSLFYSNRSDTPPSQVTFDLTFTDSDGNVAVGSNQAVININAVDDATTVTGLPTSLDFTEDMPLGIFDISAATFADVDSPSISVTIEVAAGGIFTLANPGGLITINGNGTNSVTFIGAPADINTYLNTPTNFRYTPPLDLNGTPATTATVTANGDMLGTINLNIAPVNDDPDAVDDSVATDADLALGEDDGARDITADILGNDSDPDTGDVLTVTAINTTGTTGLVTLVGGVLSYDPNGAFESLAAGTSVVDTFTYTISDGIGGTDTATVSITINGTNDAPVNTVPGPQATDEDTPLTLTGFSVADPDAGSIRTVVSVNNGLLSISVFGFPFTLPSLTLVGTPADINAVLATLVYRPNADFTGTETLTVRTTDNSVTDTDTVDITVNPVNDAPVNTIPVPQATDEDTALVFSAGNGNQLSIADVDAAGGTVSTILNVASGTLAVTTGGGANIVDDGTDTVTITGTVAQVNVALATVTYTPTLDVNGADTLTVTTNDNGNTGAGGAQTDIDTVDITINPVNDAPVNTVPGSQATNEDIALVFSAGNGNQLSIADVDAAGGIVTTVLNVASGTLAVTTSGGANIVDDGTGTVTITGTIAQVNAALATVTYSTPLNFNGTDTLTVTTNDGGNTGTGGALNDIDTVDITINPVNDAPVNTVPGSQAINEDTTLVFSAGNGNQLSIADVDVAGGTVSTVLNVASGTLAITVGGGATIANDGTNNVTITGTVAQVNAALINVTYTPPVNFNGADTLTVTTNDNGNTGAGGPLIDTDIVAITINPVNDAPVNSVPGTQTTDNDIDLVFSVANGNQISISDIDAGAGTMTTILAVPSGSLTTAAGSGAIVAGNGSANVTISGTLAQVNAALSLVTYTPDGLTVGTIALTVTTGDNGNSGGGNLIDTDQIAIELASGLGSTGTDGQNPSDPTGQSNDNQSSNFSDTPGNPIGFQNGNPGQDPLLAGLPGFGGGRPVDNIITAGIGDRISGKNGISESDLPGNIDLHPTSDTGFSNLDDITADTTPLLIGKAPADSIVTIKSSLGGVLGTVTADENGQWRFAAPSLSDGVHEFIATPTDEDGNEGVPSIPLLVTIDTAAPDTPPAPAFDGDVDQLRSNDAPTFKGKAEPGARIVLTSDPDGVVGEVIADENGNWQVTTGPLSENAHQLRLTATDAAGNTSPSSPALELVVRGEDDTALHFDAISPVLANITGPDGSVGIDPINITALLSGFTDQVDASELTRSGEKTQALGFMRQLQKAGNTVNDQVLSSF